MPFAEPEMALAATIFRLEGVRGWSVTNLQARRLWGGTGNQSLWSGLGESATAGSGSKEPRPVYAH